MTQALPVISQRVRVRPGRDEDAAGFIALIAACWAEYPGCVFDLDGEVPELRALASHSAARRAALWVAEAEDRVVGMVTVAPAADGAWEIGKMYVERGFRGADVARTLLATAEIHARENGADRMELWSDTRFERAHRFYEKCSYVRSGPIRTLDDKSHSIEFHYAKPWRAVRALDVAAADSAIGRLCALSIACADAGRAGPAPAEAREAWRRVARDVATGARLLFAAWMDGVLAGAVQLDLAMPADAPHRAEVRDLLVHPSARRRGLARALMTAAEAGAAARGRSLLTLTTRSGAAAEVMCRSRAWTEGGRIPGYVLDPDGTPREAVILYRRV